MTLEDFKAMPEQKQKEVLVDAHKLDEHKEDSTRYEFFGINDFYVEVKTNFSRRYRTITNYYQWRDIPLYYASKVIAYVMKG